jgi:GNAT superfamily N-acetyltransferase
MKIRAIDPLSAFEVELVAQRMLQTLVEVLGEEEGSSMYSMDWLIHRVRWHLNPLHTNGRVFLLEDPIGTITGHAIARIDHGSSFGYFATIFIETSSRRKGAASRLINHVEDWFLQFNMTKVHYNTAVDHVAVLNLFKSHGYDITHVEADMVQLTKCLAKL